MATCRITVVKCTVHPELASAFLACEAGPCPVFHEGQEFNFVPFEERPQGFCDWAWDDIYKVIAVLAGGGSFARGQFAGWMREDRSMITCCTDGVRPVIFKIEMLEG